MSTYVNPSGEQYVIQAGAWSAVVTEVGATLRSLAHGDVPIVDGFEVSEMAAAGRGQVLAPWPNRIRDGRYRFGGQEFQLPLSEPARRNASHGLVRWVPWTLIDRAEDFVRLGCRLHPQPGYPFSLRLEVRYSVSGAAGLEVRFRAENLDVGAAPFGVGFHPYLLAGPGPVDGWRLQVPASEMLLSDERMLPVGRAEVSGEFDFRVAKAIGAVHLDTCFTGLSGGEVVVEGQRRVALWFERGFSHLMVFSGDGLPERARRGLAVEPMTCAPDAFNSGEGLLLLEPGKEVDLRWGIGLRS